MNQKKANYSVENFSSRFSSESVFLIINLSLSECFWLRAYYQDTYDGGRS